MKNDRNRVYSFLALAIGTACGGLVAVIAVLAITHESPVKWMNWSDLPWDLLNGVDWARFRGYALYPAMVGGLAGAAIGGAVRVTRVSRHVPLLCLVLAWGCLGA